MMMTLRMIKTMHLILFNHILLPYSYPLANANLLRPAVYRTQALEQWFLTFLHILPPFFKQDYQIYPQSTKWWSFAKNMKLTYSYSLV